MPSDYLIVHDEELHMSKNTERLEQIYHYIEEQWQELQTIPTQREIARDCGFSIVTVSNCLSMLEAQGRITRQPYKSRSIRIINIPVQEQANQIAEAVFAYVSKEIQAGNVPTQKEIADTCYLSRGAVRQALLWLEAQKRIKLIEGQRNIRLVESLPE